ncbi:methyl-accepting chemotaxis protein [Brevibacillus fulvus]|uniref:Methyl-accepting chemotaxis protein n=1 Tax=Brevibacillus fulvus TaxID=1125967 RepID=A0A939BQ59_9BACL|nr:methyl-accepting chemotaxis protein [Brevibacillus fulvus]MBM7591270.1 methyl-accepting chemotaxis protein [Brevibacillus fulvus]
MKTKFSFKKFNTTSLRFKLAVILLLVALLPMLCTTIFYSAYFDNMMTQEIQEKENNLAEANATTVDYFVNKKIELTQEIIKQHPEFRNGDVEQIKKTMKAFAEVDSEVEYFAYINKDGISVNAEGVLTNVTDRDYFIQSRDTKKPFISDLLINKKNGKHIIVAAVPILDENQNYIGGVNCVLNPDILSQLTKGIKVGQTGYGYLISANGMILTHPEPDRIGKTLDEAFTPELAKVFKDNVIAKESGTFTFTALDGSEKIGSFKTIPNLGWRLVIVVPAEEVFEQLTTSMQLAITLIVVVAILAIIMAIFVARRAIKPILQVSGAIKTLANGDLTPRLQINSKDEIGQLSHDLNATLDSLSAIIEQARQVSEQVAASSEQLTATSAESVQASNQISRSIQEIVGGTENQLQASEQTSRVMDEMAIGIQRVAESSSSVSEACLSSMDEVQLGNQRIADAISQMKKIKNSVGSSAKDVQMLEEYSQKIGQIVSVITEISNQTQLLSLNASIEAARAGEHGKGFAVVGNEVKKLAEESKNSAANITELITEIQGMIVKAVTAMNEGVVDVEKGAELLDDTGKVFHTISNTFQQITEQIQEVSAASQQMSASTEEVSATMTDIVNVSQAAYDRSQGILTGAQQQLAAMEEISSSTNNLSKLAQELQEELAKFKIANRS